MGDTTLTLPALAPERLNDEALGRAITGHARALDVFAGRLERLLDERERRGPATIRLTGTAMAFLAVRNALGLGACEVGL